MGGQTRWPRVQLWHAALPGKATATMQLSITQPAKDIQYRHGSQKLHRGPRVAEPGVVLRQLHHPNVLRQRCARCGQLAPAGADRHRLELGYGCGHRRKRCLRGPSGGNRG